MNEIRVNLSYKWWVPDNLFYWELFFTGSREMSYLWYIIHAMSKKFTHLDKNDNPSMVNVGTKQITKRKAIAQAIVKLNKEVIAMMEGDEIKTKKGPIFQTAILAGIMGAKKTADLIPLCHPLGLEKAAVEIKRLDEEHIKIICETSLESKTGVEMEALTGASVAALTIYDMCKSFGHEMIIKEIKLLEKKGGKSDYKI